MTRWPSWRCGSPRGRSWLLASRSRPPLPVALLRAQGQLVEVGVGELAMDEQEARALLEGAGVGLADAEVAELVRRTEGWPVGLYLAALALQGRRPAPPAGFGVHRRRPVHGRLPALGAAGPPVTGAGDVPDPDGGARPACPGRCATRSLPPAGRAGSLRRWRAPTCCWSRWTGTGEWYRYHHLFRELLRGRAGAARARSWSRELHVRAAAWCEANGLPETGDRPCPGRRRRRPGRPAGRPSLAQPAYAAGRVDTVRRWLAWFEDQELIERYPPVAVLGAWLQALVGQAGRRRALGRCGRARARFTGTLPDGSTMESWLALLRALLCRDGVERMRADAQAAVAGLAPASPWRATALLLEGDRLPAGRPGRPGRSDPGPRGRGGRPTPGPCPPPSTALAERSIVAMDRQRLGPGRRPWPSRRLRSLQAGRLDDYVMSPLVYAVAARTALHRGDLARAREHLVQAARLRPLLTYAMPQSRRADAAGAGPRLPGAGRRRRRQDGPARRPATSSSCDPTSASCPSRPRSCGSGSTPVRDGPPGCRRSPPPSCGCSRCCPPT